MPVYNIQQLKRIKLTLLTFIMIFNSHNIVESFCERVKHRRVKIFPDAHFIFHDTYTFFHRIRRFINSFICQVKKALLKYDAYTFLKCSMSRGFSSIISFVSLNSSRWS